MHPVEPSTIVRGPAALTISFMTSADSHPWQVRWPDVKYSSIVTRLIPLKGSRTCVALVKVVSAINLSLFPDPEPVGLRVRLTGLRCIVTKLRSLIDVLQRHFASAQTGDERHQRGTLGGVVEGGADLVGHHAGAER